jgi:hypothetical protein
MLMETGDSFIVATFSNSCEIFIDLIFGSRGSADHFFFKFFESLLAYKLNLGLKANVKILIDQGSCQLLLYLVIDVFVILVSVFIIVSKSGLKDIGASLAEPFDDLPLTLFFELIASSIDQCNCLILELIASERSDHNPLIRQVQLLLGADLLPSITHKETKTVQRDILGIFRLGEQGIRSFGIKTISKFLALQVELILLKNLMRQHAELKVEEVGWF